MTHFVDAILEPALWFVADWSLRWAALIAVIALVLWMLRPRRAALRQLLLFVTLVDGLLMPLAPRWGDGWERTPQENAPPPQAQRWSASPSRDREEVEIKPIPQGRASEEAPRSELVPPSLPPAETLGTRRLVVLGLASCWTIAVVYMLIHRLAGWLFLRRLRREAVDIDGTTELLSACRTELQVRSRVRLAANPRVRSPILCGMFRPLIFVPMDWLQLSPERRRAVLLHELAHVRRRDHWLAPILDTIRIVFFFHPLVCWLLARLEYERELLCDEMVVRRGVDPRDYARLLLEFARASGRLAWPTASLPMSRRRTVKGRIHHLLEEDMERWIRPLPARWAIVLGMALLALTLGLASYRVLAEEKKKEKPVPAPVKEKKGEDAAKPAENKLKREELRYGGKDFNEWRHDLLTELKGSIRVDGMKAFAAFGANGYGTEATEAILDIIRGYDLAQDSRSDDDNAIVNAGIQAVLKIGAAALPALRRAVEGKNRNTRCFAILALEKMKSDGRFAVPSLLKAMKNEDVVTRLLALEAIRNIDPDAKGFVPALIEALKDEDAKMRYIAAARLRGTSIVEVAKPAIPALLEALQDKTLEVRYNAIQTLNSIGAEKQGVIPVSRLLREKDFQIQKEAYRFLKSLGADAKEAVPALIGILKDPKDGYLNLTVTTLESIGPGAKEAIPALSQLLRNGRASRELVISALKAIDPDGKR
jgi:beta-lactamase regulating signal transducer with metallopeptidase domain/HEAT repeat protein